MHSVSEQDVPRLSPFQRQQLPNKNTKSSKTAPLASLVYLEVTLILVSLVCGGVALLVYKPPVFLWLPSLLILAADAVSLASLIYLNKGVSLYSRSNLLLYVLLSVFLIVYRLFCSTLLVIGIFLPHSRPIVSLPLLLATLLHSIFGFVAIGKAAVYRGVLDKRQANKNKGIIEEIAIISLQRRALTSQSTNTLLTNIDDGEELVRFD